MLSSNLKTAMNYRERSNLSSPNTFCKQKPFSYYMQLCINNSIKFQYNQTYQSSFFFKLFSNLIYQSSQTVYLSAFATTKACKAHLEQHKLAIFFKTLLSFGCVAMRVKTTGRSTDHCNKTKQRRNRNIMMSKFELWGC